ncbi:MAG: hypothetical protein MZW92_09910 [Comamonadaceae bacterium]|nr:hypothetical protein [Comamonadaceae bacterium]
MSEPDVSKAYYESPIGIDRDRGQPRRASPGSTSSRSRTRQPPGSQGAPARPGRQTPWPSSTAISGATRKDVHGQARSPRHGLPEKVWTKLRAGRLRPDDDLQGPGQGRPASPPRRGPSAGPITATPSRSSSPATASSAATAA